MGDKFAYFFIIFLSVFLLITTVIYYYNQEDKCISNPLVFSARKYLETEGIQNIYGTLQLIPDFRHNGIEIRFNEKKSWVVNPPN